MPSLFFFGTARRDQLRHFGAVLPPGGRLVMPEETTKDTISIYPTPGGCVLGPRDRTRERGCLLGAGRVWGGLSLPFTWRRRERESSECRLTFAAPPPQVWKERTVRLGGAQPVPRVRLLELRSHSRIV